MTEATIVEWFVPDGGGVERGQPLYLLETDKVETEIESPATGAVRHIGETGVTYPVGTLIAEITES
jgi:pyruvate/2-oxoglutarate dehydrogenase complex dihydrolipoamide acyltransferase (E2) component